MIFLVPLARGLGESGCDTRRISIDRARQTKLVFIVGEDAIGALIVSCVGQDLRIIDAGCVVANFDDFAPAEVSGAGGEQAWQRTEAGFSPPITSHGEGGPFDLLGTEFLAECAEIGGDRSACRGE